MNWSKDEDRVLAEIILKHIRDGNVMKVAFEEASGKLNRPITGCSSRWSIVKAFYPVAIKEAKKIRKRLKRLE